MSAQTANSADIRPLTKRTKQGELYTRRADAELQITKILSLENRQIMRMTEQKRRDEPDYLLDETIIYLLREAFAGNDNFTIETLYAELNRRTWKLLAKFRGNFPINQADFDDFGQKTEMAILEKIFQTNSNAADYAEINFGDFVITQAWGIRKQTFARVKRENEMLEHAGADDENDNKLENLAQTGELSAEDRLIIGEGLGKLSPAHQTIAAMLLDGFQIESIDANELTISKYLDVSSRTIRNWIREMRSTLANYQGEVRR